MNNYIVVYPNPIADFFSDPSNATEFDPNITFINQSTVACTYNWSFGEPASQNDTSTWMNPSHYYVDPGTYDVNLLVTTDKGCKDSVKKQVNIAKEFAIYVPNAFSPNEDTKNEVFIPVGVGIDEDKYEMQIYNRWGELIFESNNLSKGWDGKSKGGKETVQEDIYVWKIIAYDLKDMAHNLSGSVMVVR